MMFTTSGMIRLGKIFGFEILLDRMFLILFLFTFFITGTVIGGIILGVSLFVIILVHELGHSLMARLFGIGTNSIMISFFGGLASLQRLPKKAWQTGLIAFAGPAVNLLCALGAYLVMMSSSSESLQPFIGYFCMWSLFLGVFNLFPAEPLDGGLIMGAIIDSHLDHTKSNRIKAIVTLCVWSVVAVLGLLFSHIFIAMFSVLYGYQMYVQYKQRGII